MAFSIETINLPSISLVAFNEMTLSIPTISIKKYPISAIIEFIMQSTFYTVSLFNEWPYAGWRNAGGRYAECSGAKIPFKADL
jgi:hypothetical protein